jgi:hypothetical protein
VIDVMKSLKGEKIMKKVTQRTRVLRHLEDYGSITTWQAYSEYGITRLSAVIFDLIHKDNIKIDCSERLTVKNRYGEKVSCTKYKLIRGE